MTYLTPSDWMAKLKKPDQKALELKRTGTLNPRPDSVSDGLFKETPFFDRKDLLHVRYEMLRRQRGRRLDRRCGYQVWCFPPHGLSGQGCIPASRPERFAPQAPRAKKGTSYPRRSSSMCGACELRPRPDDHRLHPGRSGEFGITVHRRSLERALAAKKKPRKPT